MSSKFILDDNNLEGLPSVGPATKTKLNSIGVKRISDLILFLPSFLIDKTSLTKISTIEHASSCLFIGVIEKVYKSKGAKQNLILSIRVEHICIQIRFLHKIMIYSNLKPGLKIRFSYCFVSLVIKFFILNEFKRLAPTLEEKLFPILVITGNPLYKESTIDVWPL